jgi:hypothetical protein
LIEYAQQVPCYICEEDNTFDAELCRRCQAPMAISHQANSQKLTPQMVGCIGVSGVGKTVYLGMLLDILSRQPERMPILARGAFSIAIQHATSSMLSRCEYPDKTPSEPDRWNWVHCQLRPAGRRRPVELIMPDVAGESLVEEVDHPYTFPVVRSFLQKCSGALILVDSTKLHGGAHDQDYFGMKLLSYLYELDVEDKKGWRTRPITIVFTKADQCEECFEDPEAYARTHTPGLWQLCTERFKRHSFFACGVAGGSAYQQEHNSRVRVPLRVEPRGVIEPFEWLIDHL